MHFVEVTQDVMGRTPLEAPMERAMCAISQEGSGVIVLFPAKGAAGFKEAILGAEEGNQGQLCNYLVGAQILADLGVHEVVLMSNSHHAPIALSEYGLRIVGKRSY